MASLGLKAIIGESKKCVVKSSYISLQSSLWSFINVSFLIFVEMCVLACVNMMCFSNILILHSLSVERKLGCIVCLTATVSVSLC